MPDEIPQLQECPDCKQKSLRFRAAYNLYECTNDPCSRIFSVKDLARIKGIHTDKPSEVNSNKSQTPTFLRRVDSQATRSVLQRKRKYLPILIVIGIVLIASILLAIYR